MLSKGRGLFFRRQLPAQGQMVTLTERAEREGGGREVEHEKRKPDCDCELSLLQKAGRSRCLPSTASAAAPTTRQQWP